LQAARQLQNRLWQRLCQKISPEAKDLLYEYGSLNLLTNSLGDMLNPGAARLLIPTREQLKTLQGQNCRAAELLERRRHGARRTK